MASLKSLFIFIIFIPCLAYSEQLKMKLTEGELRHRKTHVVFEIHYADDQNVPHTHGINLNISADYVVEEVDENGSSSLLIIPDSLQYQVLDNETAVLDFDSDEIHPIAFQNIIAPSLKVVLAPDGKVREVCGMNEFFLNFKEEMGRAFEIDEENIGFLEELHFMLSSALEQNLVIFPQTQICQKGTNIQEPYIWHSSLRMSPLGRLQTVDFPNSQELYMWTLTTSNQKTYQVQIDGLVSGSGDLGPIQIDLCGSIQGDAEVEKHSGWTTKGHVTWEYRYRDKTNEVAIPPEAFSSRVEISVDY